MQARGDKQGAKTLQGLGSYAATSEAQGCEKLIWWLPLAVGFVSLRETHPAAAPFPLTSREPGNLFLFQICHLQKASSTALSCGVLGNAETQGWCRAGHHPQVLSAHRSCASFQGIWSNSFGNALGLLKSRRAQLFPSDLGKLLCSSNHHSLCHMWVLCPGLAPPSTTETSINRVQHGQGLELLPGKERLEELGLSSFVRRWLWGEIPQQL